MRMGLVLVAFCCLVAYEIVGRFDVACTLADVWWVCRDECESCGVGLGCMRHSPVGHGGLCVCSDVLATQGGGGRVYAAPHAGVRYADMQSRTCRRSCTPVIRRDRGMSIGTGWCRICCDTGAMRNKNCKTCRLSGKSRTGSRSCALNVDW